MFCKLGYCEHSKNISQLEACISVWNDILYLPPKKKKKNFFPPPAIYTNMYRYLSHTFFAPFFAPFCPGGVPSNLYSFEHQRMSVVFKCTRGCLLTYIQLEKKNTNPLWRMEKENFDIQMFYLWHKNIPFYIVIWFSVPRKVQIQSPLKPGLLSNETKKWQNEPLEGMYVHVRFLHLDDKKLYIKLRNYLHFDVKKRSNMSKVTNRLNLQLLHLNLSTSSFVSFARYCNSYRLMIMMSLERKPPATFFECLMILF
jgi:hypothetical protein